MNIKITLFALMAGFSLNILSGDGSARSSVSMTVSSPTEVDITTTFVYKQISGVAQMAGRVLDIDTYYALVAKARAKHRSKHIDHDTHLFNTATDHYISICKQ